MIGNGNYIFSILKFGKFTNNRKVPFVVPKCSLSLFAIRTIVFILSTRQCTYILDPNITKATTSTKQQYNTLKNSHPFSAVSLQSGPNRSIQKTTRSVITEQNQILDRKPNNLSPPNTNVSGEPTFQLPVKKISTVNPPNTLHTSTETKEKKQITKQPRKIQNNGVPLMGMYTNPNDVPRGELTFSFHQFPIF